MKNGQIWLDTDGNPIQAHGGCIIEHKETYYWYGEFKGVDNYPGKCQTPALGMGCYSSKDLVNWKNEGLAFETDKENSESPVHTSKVFERPKVIYKEKYQGPVVSYIEDVNEGGFVSANGLFGRDSMQITVSGNDERILLIARYDNLGKGASGAALECMNIMLGSNLTEGLEL